MEKILGLIAVYFICMCGMGFGTALMVAGARIAYACASDIWKLLTP